MQPESDDGPGWEWLEQTDRLRWHCTFPLHKQQHEVTTVDARQFKGSRWLTKEDMAQPKLLTISGVTSAELDGKRKLVLQFNELEKGMVLNSGNVDNCARMYGTWDTDQWVGRQITVFTDPTVKMQGKAVGGLAVRPPNTAAQMLRQPAAHAPGYAPRPSAGLPMQPEPAPGYAVRPNKGFAAAPPPMEREYSEIDPPPLNDDVPF